MSRAVMQQALKFIERHSKYWNGSADHPQTIVESLRAELAKPKQVPLTEEQVFYLTEANTKWMPAEGFWRLNEVKFARAIEAAQKKHYRR